MSRRRAWSCTLHPAETERASHDGICCRVYERALYEGTRADDPAAHQSYLSLDLGFDPRRHPEMVVVLPPRLTAIDYETSAGPSWAAGSRNHLLGVMRRAGYRIADPNGSGR